MIAFGVWDIFYYVFLRLLIGWPESLATWNPFPRARSLGGAGDRAGARFAVDDPGRRDNITVRGGRPAASLSLARLALIFAGGLTVIVAFCWDWRHWLSAAGPIPSTGRSLPSGK